MPPSFPQTGTAAFLEAISPFIPDEFINARWPQPHRPGRRRLHCSAQLFRVHLLAVLSPVHSFNLLARMLPEQPAWRRFAHLRSARLTPDVRMLHEFRARLGVSGFRSISTEILQPIVETYAASQRSIALIDSTDLPASDVGFKKKTPVPTVPEAPGSVRGPSRLAKPGGTSATRSTPFASGSTITAELSSLSPWFHGLQEPTSTTGGSCCPVCATASVSGSGARPLLSVMAPT